MYGIFLSPIPIVFSPDIVAFRAVSERPEKTEDVPEECPVMGFVIIATHPLEVMTDGTVDVAVDGYAFSPIISPILGASVLKVN